MKCSWWKWAQHQTQTDRWSGRPAAGAFPLLCPETSSAPWRQRTRLAACEKRWNTQTGLKMGLMLPWKQWTLTEGLEFAETTSTSAVHRRRRIYWHCCWWQRGDSETTRAKEFDPPKKRARLTSMCWDIWRDMASSLLCSCQLKHSWLILYTQKVHSHRLLFLPTNTIYTWG